MRVGNCVAVLLAVFCFSFALACKKSGIDPKPQNSSQESDPNTVRFRTEIQRVEGSLSQIPDKGAAFYLLARRYAQLGELKKSLALTQGVHRPRRGVRPRGRASAGCVALQPRIPKPRRCSPPPPSSGGTSQGRIYSSREGSRSRRPGGPSGKARLLHGKCGSQENHPDYERRSGQTSSSPISMACSHWEESRWIRRITAGSLACA
jgi:hypothetical protein